MDILPIQGSAVPCERVFSSAKETMTARRSRIKPELMEALQMLKFARSRGRSLDFTVRTSAEDQILAMETDQCFVSLVPDDITMYVRSLVEDHDSSSDSEDGDDEIDEQEDDEE
jgi:hAT family C-terminal dimerisation region